MRALTLAALVALALLSSACLSTINGHDYDCLWTPTKGVVCTPAPVAMAGRLP